MVKDAALYLLVSFVEYSSLVLMIFAIFKFKLNYLYKELLIMSSILAITSYAMVLIHMDSIIAPMQLALLVLFFKFYLKENWIYSLWTVMMGGIIYTVIQGAVVSLSVFIGLVDWHDTDSAFSNYSFLMTLFCCLLMLLIKLILDFSKRGYTFYFRGLRNTKNYISLSIISIVVVVMYVYYVNFDFSLKSFVVMLSLLIGFIIVYVALSNIREENE